MRSVIIRLIAQTCRRCAFAVMLTTAALLVAPAISHAAYPERANNPLPVAAAMEP